jgi:hypothetical protein
MDRNCRVALRLELALLKLGQCRMRKLVVVLGLLLTPAVHAQSAPAPPRKPLDLRVGDLRRYLPPGEAAKLPADRPPVSSIQTVTIEGNRERIPDRLKEPIPGGPFGAIFYSVTKPSKAWRVLVPDPNMPPAPPPRSDEPPQVPRIGCGPGSNVIFC